MRQTTILLIIYVIIVVVVIIFMKKFLDRGYSRRVIADVSPCPFGKEKYFPVKQSGDDSNAVGLVCYSLYGNYAKYAPTLFKQLEEIPKELPGWVARVYVPIDIPGAVWAELVNRGAVVIKMNGGEDQQSASQPNAPQVGIKGHEGALWRFLGATQTKPFICLDADDRLYNSIGKKVKAWLKSGKTFFIFKPWEILLPMAAGRWGGRGVETEDGLVAPIPEMLDIINEYCEHWFGLDECVLKKRIFRQYVRRMGVYRTFYWPITDLLIFGIIVMTIGAAITLAAARGLDNEIKVCRLK